jgi:hypothetical protein
MSIEKAGAGRVGTKLPTASGFIRWFDIFTTSSNPT